MSALGEWDDDPAGQQPADDAEGAPGLTDEQGPQLYFPTVDAFVEDHLVHLYRRDVTTGRHRTWCPQWWRHAEAIARLEALWRAWEHLRLDPALGMSIWFRDHADHHMTVLLDPDGPFKGCSLDKGHSQRLHPLSVRQPPEDLPDVS